jgi:hypothetical protein
VPSSNILRIQEDPDNVVLICLAMVMLNPYVEMTSKNMSFPPPEKTASPSVDSIKKHLDLGGVDKTRAKAGLKKNPIQ